MNIKISLKKALILFAIITCFMCINSIVFADDSSSPEDIENAVKSLMDGGVTVVQGNIDNGNNKSSIYYLDFGTNINGGNQLHIVPNGNSFFYQYWTSEGYAYQVNVVIDIETPDNTELSGGYWMLAGENFDNLVYVLDENKQEQGKIDLNSLKNIKYKASYIVPGDDTETTYEGERKGLGTTTSGGFSHGNIFDFFLGLLQTLVEWRLNVIGRIINLFLLTFGDSVKSLITNAIGASKLSIEDVIFNIGDGKKFSINFWSNTLPSDSIGYMMKNIISTLFNYFRGFAIVAYLIMLLYSGIRIILSSTAGKLQVAKEKLMYWALGVVALFFMPMVMKYVVEVNDGVVASIYDNTENGSTDIMEQIRERAYSYESGLALTVIYIIMVGQLLVLVMMYYKRAFTIGFLIIIFPVVAVYYMWERAHKGNARSLENWTREYCVMVFTQLVHAVVYSIIIRGMYIALTQNESSSSNNYFLYLICVLFLFKAEKIVKQIFNVRSSANTIGDLATSGAAAFAVTQSIGGVFKKGNNGQNAEDKAEEEKETNKVNTLKSANKADALRKEVESRESERNTETNTNSNTNTNTNNTGTPTVTRESVTQNTNTRTSNQANAGSVGTAGTVQNPSGAHTVATPTASQSHQATGGKQNNQMSDFEKVRAVQNQKALKAKNGGRARRVAKFVVRNAGRVAGVTVGLAVGAAAGDASKAVTTAATFGMIGAKLGNGVTKIADVGINRYAGHRMKMKSLRGDFVPELRAAGVSEEFIQEVYDNNKIEDAYQKAKGDAIRKALANEMGGTRRGGKSLGEVKLMNTIESENRQYEKHS